VLQRTFLSCSTIISGAGVAQPRNPSVGAGNKAGSVGRDTATFGPMVVAAALHAP
jgi:hypothetical protein